MYRPQLSSSDSSSKSIREGGFTLVEVLVSMAVLAIGLLSIAALIAGTLQAGTRARYMSMASILASEKLDSLNKWPSGEEQQTSGTTTFTTQTAESADPTDGNIWPGGTLPAAGTACAANNPYCDQVTVSESTGADYETQTQMVMNPGTPPTWSPVTTVIVHTSSGCVGTPAACGVTPPSGGGSTFTRFWEITQNPPITSLTGAAVNATGTRRITVLVMMNTNVFSTPVTFQMSMVRP